MLVRVGVQVVQGCGAIGHRIGSCEQFRGMQYTQPIVAGRIHHIQHACHFFAFIFTGW